jgi:hypothetical protein
MDLTTIDMSNYKKVSESGGTFVTAIFFNPETMETVSGCVRDYDYEDGSRDIDELYYMPIDENARILWLHSQGVILVGDTVRVVKGRTLEHGYTDIVKDIRPYKDRYGRRIADYVYFENGKKINIDNCELA